MLWLLDRAAQLTNLKRDTSCPEPLTCEAALETTALVAALLFAHGQPRKGVTVKSVEMILRPSMICQTLTGVSMMAIWVTAVLHRGAPPSFSGSSRNT
jgi:hypothetical protein